MLSSTRFLAVKADCHLTASLLIGVIVILWIIDLTGLRALMAMISALRNSSSSV